MSTSIPPSENAPASESRHGRSGYPSYGYDVAPYGDTGPHRTLRDYLLVLRERFWIILVVFVPVVLAAAVLTYRKTPIYQAVATVEILRTAPVVMPVQDVISGDIRSPEDLNTQVRILESGALIDRVAKRLVGEDQRRFMAPFQKGRPDDPVQPAGVLAANRKIIPLRLSLVIAIQYSHPDPETAARVANLFIEEYIAHTASQRVKESMKAVEDLKYRADEQRRKVEEIERQLQTYKERNNMVSLDQRKDIVTEKLKLLSSLVTQSDARASEAEVLWNFVQRYRQENRPLTEISFIAQAPLIANLQQQLASQKIAVSQLGERYRAKHPRMIEALNALNQTQKQLDEAVNSSASKIETDFLTAKRSLEEARDALTTQETEAFKLDRLAVDYETLNRELLVEEQLFQSILGRMRETTMTSTIESQNARVMDYANKPNVPASPNHVIDVGIGALAGLGLGLGLAFLIAFLDDRVKSAYDVESIVGLPLIGIVPLLRKLDGPTRAQIAINNADARAAESFRTLHSSLRLHEDSKLAKVILVTSTIPGEGKSFVACNLALTFASHGERTLLIDADLRKPSLHRIFGTTNDRGVVDLATAPAADAPALVHGGLQPNLSLLATGGRSKNPTQLLGSREFERFLRDIRGSYDRIIIDTPPLAAVSDAITLLPLADGCVFTVQFNRVRRKAAQTAVRRLHESNAPVFGAVLNGLNLSVAGYYYAQYYDKSYEQYYVTNEAPAEK